MARITCAISGIRFNCSYLEDISIPHTEGYFHPIFALPYTQLHRLYSQHCRMQLTSNDSYLLFMAFLHSSGKVEWKHPATLSPNDPQTKKFIENNLSQLIRVLEKTGIIRHPSFKQPSYRVTYENANLRQVPNWIKEWLDNIDDFIAGKASMREQEDLQKIENRLSYLILSGEKPERFSHVIASWANQAAEFPQDKAEDWMKTIRSCFNINKMFNTPLPVLKEIKEYCESNIEAGSIHFHTLSHVIKEGIKRHVDYLGGSSLALGYTLLPSLEDGSTDKKDLKNAAELATLIAKAPASPPKEGDYSTSLEFLRAKLAYRVASTSQRQKEL